MKIKTALIQLVSHHRLSLLTRAPFTRPAVTLALCLAAALAVRGQTPVPPVVTGVTASQISSNGLVNIYYTISDANFTNDNVYVLASSDAGATWNVPALTFEGAYGSGIGVTTIPNTNLIAWFAGIDWPGNYTTNCRVRVLANNLGLVLVPPGSYNRGNYVVSQSSGDSDITDAPVYPVNVSAFYIDSTLVTGGKWNLVVGAYASSHGYTFDNPGSFKAVNHPVQNVNWYDCVKWCNARSQMEGVTPCYYTNAGMTALYTNGDVDVVYVNTNANGYRLPTEAEWEKAARGGVSGHRFPWINVDTISEIQANYALGSGASFDLGGTNTYATGAQPYTSPVGSFAANGYALSDMAGNVYEWCWDWYGSNYYTSGQINPQGPGFGTVRVERGGSWNSIAGSERCAQRAQLSPGIATIVTGFRCVRGQP